MKTLRNKSINIEMSREEKLYTNLPQRILHFNFENFIDGFFAKLKPILNS